MKEHYTGYDTFSSTKVHKEYEAVLVAIPHYHELQQKLAEKIREYILDNFTAQTDSSSIIIMMDLWCWTGITSQFMISALPENARYYLDAIDNNRDMLNQFSRNSTINRLKKEKNLCVETHFTDAFDALRDIRNQYDIIFTCRVLHNLTDDERAHAYKKIFAALKPGWLFINADKIAIHDADLHLQQVARQAQQTYKIQDTELRDERLHHYAIDEQPGRIMYENTTQAQLLDAWFTDISISDRIQLEEICSAKKST